MQRQVGEIFKIDNRWIKVESAMEGNISFCKGCVLKRIAIQCNQYTDITGLCYGQEELKFIDISETLLHLSVKNEWYDMIVNGEKDEEYREFKPYWFKFIGKYYSHVLIRRGYTKEFVIYPIIKTYLGTGKPEWGAPDKNCIIIKLNKNNVWKEKLARNSSTKK